VAIGGRDTLCLSIALLLFAIPLLGASRPRRNVLLLNSYHPGHTWCDLITDAIRNELEAATYNVEVHVEYLDTKRYPSKAYLENVSQALAAKYPRGHFDVVVSADDGAYQFLLNYRDRLFPGCPSVFCGVTDFKFSDLEGKTGITGVLETADMGATIDVMLSLLPRVIRVVIIHDDTPTGRGYRQECERQIVWLRLLYPRLRVTYYSGVELTTEELLGRVKRLTKSTIVLMTHWARGKDGTYVSDREFMSELSTASSVPLCGTKDVQRGIVGGKLISAEEQGRAAARMALQILGGSPTSAIPLRMRSVNRYTFDYMQLKRWRIANQRLPVGSRIINRPDSFYERFRWYIIGGGMFALIESCIIMLLVVNIAQRRRLEQQRMEWQKRMEQTRKLEGLGVLAGGIAHDFNNLLTVILGNADLLLMEEPEKSPRRPILTDIVAASRQGEKLAREMLVYAGKAHFTLASARLNDLAVQTEKLLSATDIDRTRLIFSLGEKLGTVMVDEAQMRRVILNLLSNAIEAVAGTGGTVRVETAEQECSEEVLRSLWLGSECVDGRYAVLTIRDDGPGIEANVLEHIFDPFYSTKFTGRGLGLAAVYAIIGRHNGCIGIQSTEGEGTCVTIYLPAFHDDMPLSDKKQSV